MSTAVVPQSADSFPGELDEAPCRGRSRRTAHWFWLDNALLDHYG
jgi:hypothetical protein